MFDENLQATGMDWLEYEAGEKIEIIRAIFDAMGVPGKNSADIGVKALDDFYYQLIKDAEKDPGIDKTKVLSVPCSHVVAKILESSISKKTGENNDRAQ